MHNNSHLIDLCQTNHNKPIQIFSYEYKYSLLKLIANIIIHLQISSLVAISIKIRYNYLIMFDQNLIFQKFHSQIIKKIFLNNEYYFRHRLLVSKNSTEKLEY